ncbi:MAG: lipid A deacylase LpxR family protein [Verrucomicrobia bacterium]|nr:lipid A deacylase LpxR family protein [Verrucomicrobiota bacterium]
MFTDTDRNYTNGARVALVRPIPEEQLTRLQTWMQNFTGRAESIERTYTWGTGLTQLMFTPQDSEVAAPPPGQRPYAGWLGLELSLHAHNAQALNSFALVVGTTGKASMARQAQDFVHKHISNSPIFQGWETQAPFELTIGLHYDRKRNLTFLETISADLPVDVDGFIEWGAAVGNFRTDAYAGFMVAIGYNLPGTYVYPRIQLGSYVHRVAGREERLSNPVSVGIFLGGRGNAVLHDITLDGPLFRSWDYAVGSKPWVGEYVFGVGVRYSRFGLIFSRTFRSKEFKDQTEAHRFGSVQLTMGF